MKTKFLLCLAVAIMASLTSQAGDGKVKIQVKWGDEFQVPKKHIEENFVGNMQDGFLLISMQQRKSVCFQKFDTALKANGEKVQSLEALPKQYGNQGIRIVGRKVYWFYSQEGQNDVGEHLYAQEIDVKKGDFAGPAREIAVASDAISGYWSTDRSADSSKFLLKYTLLPVRKRGEPEFTTLGLVVMDNTLKQLWKKEVELPYSQDASEMESYQIDRNGNVFVLLKVYESGKKKEVKDDQPNYHYEVLKYSRTTDKPAIAKFDFGDRYVVDIALVEDYNGRMICAGFYSGQAHFSAEGAFLYTFDEATMATKAIDKGFYEFPIEVMKQYESERTQKKLDKAESKGKSTEVPQLKFKSLRVAEDGSITLFGEQSYVVQVSYYSGNTWYTRTTYHEDDIYAVKVAADGQLKWVRKVPKRQAGNSTIGLSYFLRSDGNDNYLFFADNIKNLDLHTDEVPAAHVGGAGGILMCVKITDDGVVSKSNIYDFREEGAYMYPENFRSVSARQIIGRGRDHKISLPLLINME